MTLIEDFRKELVNMLKGVAKERLPNVDCFKIVERQGKILSFRNDIASSHLRAIRTLRLKSKNLGRLISDKELGNLLTDFIFDIKYGDEANVMAEIDKHIAHLFEKLRSMRPQRHLFVIPIMSLRLMDDVSIGDSMLVNLNERALASLEARYSVNLSFSDKSLAQTANEMVERNETSVFAAVVVDAPDKEKALELAIQKADTCLNALRLYGFTAPFVVRDEFRTRLLRGMVHVNLDEKSYSEMLGSVNLVANVPTLSLDLMKKMKQDGFEMINELLIKEADELTSLQEDILTAIFWFGNSVKEEHRNMKFIKSVIALETLLAPDGGRGKGDKISKRFASILYAPSSDDEKTEAFLTMRSLYGVRNSIIHSGEGYVYEDDLDQMMYWTQATIRFLLQYAEKYNSIFELITKEFPIDDSLYSGL